MSSEWSRRGLTGVIVTSSRPAQCTSPASPVCSSAIERQTVARAPANGIELEYQTFGDDSGPPMLLIAGLGAQLTSWENEFCGQLADRGFFLIRFDNRDAGLSTTLGAASPELGSTLREVETGIISDVPYSLEDMAKDAIGLLDHLRIPGAHVVGQSLGGMIAQVLAINYCDRVLSLCSIMSTTGDRKVGQPSPEMLEMLRQDVPSERDEVIRYWLRQAQIGSSPRFPLDESEALRRLERDYDHGYYPPGRIRQTIAALAAGDRTADLGRVTAPTLVIHGDADASIAVSGGKATAKAIPGAKFILMEGVGHERPRPIWPMIIDAIVANAARAPTTDGTR
jgi:pimeloyl-ACP methyl ester carboxylesterase